MTKQQNKQAILAAALTTAHVKYADYAERDIREGSVTGYADTESDALEAARAENDKLGGDFSEETLEQIAHEAAVAVRDEWCAKKMAEAEAVARKG